MTMSAICCCARGRYDTPQTSEGTKWKVVEKISLASAAIFTLFGAASIYVSLIETPPYHTWRDLGLGVASAAGIALSGVVAHMAKQRQAIAYDEVEV